MIELTPFLPGDRGISSASNSSWRRGCRKGETGPLIVDYTSTDISAHIIKENTTKQEDDFSSYYLRKVTMELEEDLDKIRSAGDFTDSSLPILITALRQGEAVFSHEEKQRIMGKQGWTDLNSV